MKLSERKKALERLKQLVPGYLASYTKEGKLINDNTDALTRYIAKLKEKAYMESLKQEMVEAYTKQRQAQREVDAKTTNVQAVEKELKKDRYKSDIRVQGSAAGVVSRYEANGARTEKLYELNFQKAAQKAAQQKLDASNALLKSLDAEAQKRKEAFAAEIMANSNNNSGGGHIGILLGGCQHIGMRRHTRRICLHRGSLVRGRPLYISSA